MEKFTTFVYTDGSPCIVNKERVTGLREAPGGHTWIDYDNGRTFEVVRDIMSVRREIYGEVEE